MKTIRLELPGVEVPVATTRGRQLDVRGGNVGFGSKCEELNVSKSRPVCLIKQTSMRRAATSLISQLATRDSRVAGG
jgi:hypothetical protein